MKLNVLLMTCFRHFYHLDWANAQMHCASVRYSPITFRLAEELRDMDYVSDQVLSVLADQGRYAEDAGR